MTIESIRSLILTLKKIIVGSHLFRKRFNFVMRFASQTASWSLSPAISNFALRNVFKSPVHGPAQP